MKMPSSSPGVSRDEQIRETAEDEQLGAKVRCSVEMFGHGAKEGGLRREDELLWPALNGAVEKRHRRKY